MGTEGRVVYLPISYAHNAKVLGGHKVDPNLDLAGAGTCAGRWSPVSSFLLAISTSILPQGDCPIVDMRLQKKNEKARRGYLV